MARAHRGSYLAKTLLVDEQVLHRAHYHWLYVLVLLARMLTTVALAVALALFRANLAAGLSLRYERITGLASIEAAVKMVALTLTVITTLWAARELFRLLSILLAEFAVTDQRLLIKLGFIQRRTFELRLGRLESVAVDQSIIGRLLNYGTIHIIGTGASIGGFRFIARPLELRKAIAKATKERGERSSL